MSRWTVGGVFASGLLFFVGCGLNPQPEPPVEATPSGSGGIAGSSAGSAGKATGGTSSGGHAGSAAGFGGATTGGGKGGGAAGASSGSGGASAGGGGASGGGAGSSGKAGSSGSNAGAAGGGGKATGGAGGAGAGGAGAGGAGAGGSVTGGGAGNGGGGGASGGNAGGGGDGGAGGAVGGAAGAGGAGTGGAGAGGSGGGGTALVSIAHLSPDAGDVEVCAKLGGTGSYFPGVATLTGNALTKLAYLDVTKRLSVPAGTHQLAVFASSASCVGTPLLDVGSVTLASDVAYTVVANGQTGALPSTFAVDVLIDTVAVDASNAKVRFFHASPAAALGSVDVLAKPASGAFSVLFAGVAFGTAAMSGGTGVDVDANGYATLAPDSYSLGFVMAGTGLSPIVSTATPLPASAGLVATVYGTGATLATGTSYACIESSQATNLLTCVTAQLQ